MGDFLTYYTRIYYLELTFILQPGRVATLVEDAQGTVCGLGFELCPEEAEATFTYLNDRETGYKLKEVIFYPSDPAQSIQKVHLLKIIFYSFSMWTLQVIYIFFA